MLLLPVPFLLHNRIESLYAGNPLHEHIDGPRPPQPREQRYTVRPQFVACHVCSLSQMNYRHERDQQRLNDITKLGKGRHMPKQHPIRERPFDKVPPTRKQSKCHQACREDHGGEPGWPAVFGNGHVGELQGSEAVVVHLDGALANLVERRKGQIKGDEEVRLIGGRYPHTAQLYLF